MNLALIGYGKMGRMIEQLAAARGHRVVFRTDIEGNEDGQALTRENLRDAEVAIEFTVPGVVVRNVDRLSALGINLVVGTTGWMNEIERVRKLVEERGTGLVHSSNFSIGVNVFYRLVEGAAASFRDLPAYDPWIHEIHHRAKVDAPSGTALKLKQILEQAYGKKDISTTSNRAGAIPGIHTVGFDSEADTLTFTHTARSRQGFAAGALHAAEWVRGKKGFYEFSEVLFG